MKIGTFTQHGEGYTGWINTAGLDITDVTFSRVPVKQGSGPDFVIIAGESEQFELGAAWAKTSKKGRAYLSAKLDSPVFIAPINCALIGTNDPTSGRRRFRGDPCPHERITLRTRARGGCRNRIAGGPHRGGTAEQTAGGPERSARGRDGSVNPAQRAVRSRPGLLISA
jgi:uncharacterized protein (DUF736 family)